jgi:prepilin peptidase CpaA
MSSSLFFFVFPTLMVFAAGYDALTMRITNGLCLLTGMAFVPAAITAGLCIETMLQHLVCALAMLAAGFALFLRGWIGGGDAKLVAAAGHWIGWSGMAQFAALVALAGGLLALGAIAFRQVCRRRAGASATVATSCGAGLPYGIALACGALIVCPQTLWAPALMP